MSKKITILLIALIVMLSGVEASAQDKRKSDSLQNELQKFETAKKKFGENVPEMFDTTKINILSQLYFLYWGYDLKATNEYATLIYNISDKMNYEKGIAIACYLFGNIETYKTNYKLSFEKLQYALKIFEKFNDKIYLARCYSQLGINYDHLGNYPEAIKHYFTALKFKEEINDKRGVSGMYTNIGGIYQVQKNYGEALKYQLKSLKIKREIDDKKGLSILLTNLGITYKELYKFSDAMKCYDESLKLAKLLDDKNGMANVYDNLAALYFEKKEYNTALKNNFTSLKIQTEIENKEGIVYSYVSIGNSLKMLKKYNEAIEYELKALALSKEIGTKDWEMAAYRHLSEIYSSTNNYKLAFDYRLKFESLKDTMFNYENSDKVKVIQMQYEFDKKESIAKANAENKLKEQRLYMFGGIGMFFIVSVLLFFVLRNYKKQIFANRILKETQQQLIESEKLSAFGAVATRVAHEIQNPLNFVNNFSTLSIELIEEMRYAKTEKERDDIYNDFISNLEKINRHGKRAENIVKQLFEHTKAGTVHEYFEEAVV